MSRPRTDSPASPRRSPRASSGRDPHEPPLKIRLPDLSRAAAPFGRDPAPPTTAAVETPAEIAPASPAETPVALPSGGWRSRLPGWTTFAPRRFLALDWKWQAGLAVALVGASVYALSGGSSTPAPTKVSVNREPLTPAPLVVSAPPLPLMPGDANFASASDEVGPPGPVPPVDSASATPGASELGSPPGFGTPGAFGAPPGFAPTPYATVGPDSGAPLAAAPAGRPGVARLAGFIIDQESPPVEARHEPYRQSLH